VYLPVRRVRDDPEPGETASLVVRVHAPGAPVPGIGRPPTRLPVRAAGGHGLRVRLAPPPSESPDVEREQPGPQEAERQPQRGAKDGEEPAPEPGGLDSPPSATTAANPSTGT